VPRRPRISPNKDVPKPAHFSTRPIGRLSAFQLSPAQALADMLNRFRRKQHFVKEMSHHVAIGNDYV
jgi:hypothetical protein